MLTGKLLGYILPSSSAQASPEKPVPLHSFRPNPLPYREDKKDSLVIDEEILNIDLD